MRGSAVKGQHQINQDIVTLMWRVEITLFSGCQNSVVHSLKNRNRETLKITVESFFSWGSMFVGSQNFPG